MREVEREILLSFWKVHILHHAEMEAVVGQRIIRELRHHGYNVSPGTLYPLLIRMEQRGWLKCKVDGKGLRARRGYRLTKKGRAVLELVKEQIKELHREVVMGEEEDTH